MLDFAEPYALLDGPVGDGVRSAIGREFRGLWTNVSRADILERISHAVAAKEFWRDGWIGARLTRIYDGDRLPLDVLARLKTLEEFLRPNDLLDKVRGVVLSDKGGRSIDLWTKLRTTTLRVPWSAQRAPSKRLVATSPKTTKQSRLSCRN